MSQLEQHPDYPHDPVTKEPILSPEQLETGSFPVPGNREVLSRLTYLSEHDALYRERPPEYGVAENFAFDQHRGELSDLHHAMAEAGLDEDAIDVIDKYYGFRKGGQVPAAALAHELGIKESEVHDKVRAYSAKLGQTGWAASYARSA